MSCLYFIFNQWDILKNGFERPHVNWFVFFSPMLLFTCTNWFLEILKWQILAKRIKKTTYYDALKQSLSSYTVSMITPNRMGEYGLKLFFFKKKDFKKVVVLQSIQSFSQLFATLFFGLIGCFYFKYYQLAFVIMTFFAAVFLFHRLDILPQKIKFYYLKIRQLVLEVYQSVGLISIGRYLVFSTQFVVLLYWFGVENSVLDLYFALSLMYLFSSILPTLQLFDVIVKGSVGIYVFEQIDVPAAIILQVSVIMWFFNMILPYFIGIYYWLKFKPAW